MQHLTRTMNQPSKNYAKPNKNNAKPSKNDAKPSKNLVSTGVCDPTRVDRLRKWPDRLRK